MTDASTNRPPRKPYTAPDLEELGSLEDLTLSNNTAGGSDGGKKGSNKTR